MLNDASLRGVCPAVATPFTESGAVDYQSLRRLVRTLAEGGCHALILFGVAGEFYKLDDSERKRIISVATDELSDSSVPLFASITHQSANVAAEQAASAESEGIDGVMVLPPSMLDPSPTDQYNHLRTVGDAVDVPLLIQYAPDTAGSSVPISVFTSLSNDLDNICHFKVESHPPGPDISELVEQTANENRVLVGNGTV